MTIINDYFSAFDTDIRIGICCDDAACNLACEPPTHCCASDLSACSSETQTQLDYTFAQIRTMCVRYEQLFSRTLENSDVWRINAAKAQPVEVSKDTYDLLCVALKYCKVSNGVFDITVGTLTHLWDFKNNTMPPDRDIAAGLPHVGWSKVRLSVAKGTYFVCLNDPQTQIDLGGIAKGWIADQLCDYLKRTGYKNFIVNLGGNIAVRGTNDSGKPWHIGISNPSVSSSEKIIMSLQDESAVTSGTYERCFEHDGRLYHHILNPQTGHPTQSDLLSATIVCKKSLDAEGFSTTALALGLHDAMAFCRHIPQIENAFLIDKTGTVHVLYPND